MWLRWKNPADASIPDYFEDGTEFWCYHGCTNLDEHKCRLQTSQSYKQPSRTG
jgi:hypothetical protein